MSAPEYKLRSQPFTPKTVLLTGASGYVGTLAAAQLLKCADTRLFLPIRPGSEDRLNERLGIEVAAAGLNMDAVRERIQLVAWTGSDEHRASHWYADLAAHGIDEIVHCAGCLDYFDSAALEAGNVSLTAHMLEVGRALGVKRFTYVSTSYSAGYVDNVIAEQLLDEPRKDPTEYTRSKRRAEHLVAESGLPWLILRPSILIGEFDSGRYSGKRYGLYQQWMGIERLLTDRYHPAIHTVAPKMPLNLMHQDYFQQAFAAAHTWLPDGSVCNLISRNESAPTMRELWDLWLEVQRPQRVYYYQRVSDVDLRAINMRQRAYLTFAEINLEIGAHHWRFADDWLALLAQEKGLERRDANLASVKRCQDRFVRTSDSLARYRDKFQTQFPQNIYVEEIVKDVAEVSP